MEVSFDDNKYVRLETDRDFDAGLPKAVVSAYRKKVRFLRAARDMRDVVAMHSLRPSSETNEPSKALYLPLSGGYVLEIALGSNTPQSACSVRRIHLDKNKDPRGLA